MCVRIELQTNWLFLLLVLSFSVIYTRCQGEYLFFNYLNLLMLLYVIELDRLFILGTMTHWVCTHCSVALLVQDFSTHTPFKYNNKLRLYVEAVQDIFRDLLFTCCLTELSQDCMNFICRVLWESKGPFIYCVKSRRRATKWGLKTRFQM